MKKIFFMPRLLLILILLVLLIVSTHLSVEARDSNGVTITDFRNAMSYGMHIDHFTNFNPTSSSYIYNEAGESAATSGEVTITGNTGPKTLIISVPTLGSTSLDFRLEGKVGILMSTWSNIFTKNVDTATTIDIIIPISEYITAYRLGVKVNTNGTDTIYCTTSVITHK